METKRRNKKQTKPFFKRSGNIVLMVMLILCIIINLISHDELFVEKYYTNGIYFFVGKNLRRVFGNIPFSVGDVLYTIATVFFSFRIIRFFIKLFKRKINKQYLAKCLYTLAFMILSVYFLFNILWGLNYNRKGIAYQLQLNVSKNYSTRQLDSLVQDLVVKANAGRVLLGKKISYPNDKTLFNEAVQSYKNVTIVYSFLHYEAQSVKESMFSPMMSYLGTSGYYNPFTGEAQVNTTVPKFLLPYVTCHEMAHQLGYATEDEANFAGYLAAVNSFDPLFKYSTYLDLYQYANYELFFRDSVLAKKNYARLDTLAKTDLHELRSFWRSHENFIEKITTKLYSQYLKANRQPQGINTYSHVTAWLIAYKDKYGKL